MVGQAGQLRSISQHQTRYDLLLAHHHSFLEVLLDILWEALAFLVAGRHPIHEHTPIPWLPVLRPILAWI